MTEPDIMESVGADITVEVCEAGHVHFVMLDANDHHCGLHTVLSPREAFEMAACLMRAAQEADDTLRKVGVGKDVGPCTLH